MAGRRIRDACDARECLAEEAASGLTRAEWARRERIDGRSLNAWRLNLERRASAGSALRLVELVSTVETPQSQPTALRMRCGVFVVEVDRDFDRDTLARLLAVVALC